MSKQKFIYTILFWIFSSQLSVYAKTNALDDKIQQVIVIYLENHSFYNLFATFPGADNSLPQNYRGQVDSNGELYKTLPIVKESNTSVPDLRFPLDLPNQSFLIDQYVRLDEWIPDPIHEFYTHQVQINGGRNDLFAQYAGVGALAMGYYDMKKTYLWKLASEYVLADQFYQSAFGGSFLNHQWLIAAQTPHFPNAPDDIKTKLVRGFQDGARDELPKKIKPLTPDGFAVNTIQPRDFPYRKTSTNPDKRLPPLDYPTIGDRLTEKNISWAWYAGGWNDILNEKPGGLFQHHHQPFIYFKKYGPGTTARAQYLKDEEDFFKAIETGSLPTVSFYKPIGNENAHPGYSTVASSDFKVKKIIESLQKSNQWSSSLVIITFDENGGFWDPKAPPHIDRWGLGSRIPAIFVSPHVKKSFIDHTPYETVSILAYLEKKYSLPPLTSRDKNANPLLGIWLAPW